MAEARNYGVIWDVDGTLVDTAELHFRAWVELARQLDKPFTRADFAATFGWRNPEILARLFGGQLDQAEGGFEYDAERALGADEEMRQVEP